MGIAWDRIKAVKEDIEISREMREEEGLDGIDEGDERRDDALLDLIKDCEALKDEKDIRIKKAVDLLEQVMKQKDFVVMKIGTIFKIQEFIDEVKEDE